MIWENALTEVSLAAQSEILKERADRQPVVIFTKENMVSDKPVPVVILPPVMFIGGTTMEKIIYSIQGSWEP